MGNWDFVFPYSDNASDWLDEQNLPHPQVRSGNRLPSTSEMKLGLCNIGANKEPIVLLVDDFDWEDDEAIPEDAFKMRGDNLLEFCLLAELSSKCGQLWYYPDSGACAVVFDVESDPEYLHEIYLKFQQLNDSWERFHHLVYGDHA